MLQYPRKVLSHIKTKMLKRYKEKIVKMTKIRLPNSRIYKEEEVKI